MAGAESASEAAGPGPLRDLLRLCFFASEWVGSGQTLAPAGLASVVTETAPGVGAVQSVRFRESAFGAAEQRVRLPCGARSLWLQEGTPPRLLLRGMNKFVEFGGGEDVADVRPLLMSAPVRAAVRPLALQRKMAGFVVLLSAAPGGGLLVASKHSVDPTSHHVGLARGMLHRMWGDAAVAREEALSAALAEHDAVLLCEGIEPGDSEHPVEEPSEHQGRLVAFALQRARTVREEVCPEPAMRAVAAAGGLAVVPSATDVTWDRFDDACASAAVWDNDGALGEGWVATFEVPSELVRLAHGARVEAGGGAAVFRVKVKTVRYHALRQFREVLKRIGGPRGGGDTALVRLWEGLPPTLQALLAWTDRASPPVLRPSGFTGSVAPLLRDFEQGLSPPALAAWRRHCALLRPPVPPQGHTLVVSVGLPGCGKTTLLQRVGKWLVEERRCLVVYLSRDDVSAAEAQRRGEDPGAGSIQRLLARRISALLRTVRQRASARCVVICDGCHLTQGARRMLVRELGVAAPVLVSFRPGARVAVGSNTWRELCRRIEDRPAHPTLDGASAPRALAAMAPRIQYPSADASGVVEIDPVGCDVAAAAERTAAAVWAEHSKPSRGPLDADGPGRLLDFRSVSELQHSGEAELLRSLGLSPPSICQCTAYRSVTVVPTEPAVWRAATAACVDALAGLVGGAGSAEGSATQPPRSWWQWLVGAPQMTVRLRAAGEDLQWLRGALQKDAWQRERAAEAPLDNVSALRLRYGVEPRQSVLHCTLAFLAGQLPSELGAGQVRAVRELLGGDVEPWRDARVVLTCDQLLVDSKGLCLNVRRADVSRPGRATATLYDAALDAATTRSGEGGEADASAADPEAGSEAPHVTVGVTADEQPRYCARMRSSFERWRQENEDERRVRAAKRARTAAGQPPGAAAAADDAGASADAPSSPGGEARKRKRRIHNFAGLPLAEEIVLEGRLHFLRQQ